MPVAPERARVDGLTPFQHFVERWRSCTACHLHTTRQQVVLCRGTIPAQVLFIGEGPGHSEDSLGEPFVGPAGKLLDDIIAQGIPESITYAITNLVCCLPVDEETGGKAVEPDDESIKACSVRLIEFVELCRPRLIVCVGKLAKDWLEPGYRYSIRIPRDIPQVSIVHPAWILRANVAQRGLAIQRCVVTVQSAVEQYLGVG